MTSKEEHTADRVRQIEYCGTAISPLQYLSLEEAYAKSRLAVRMQPESSLLQSREVLPTVECLQASCMTRHERMLAACTCRCSAFWRPGSRAPTALPTPPPAGLAWGSEWGSLRFVGNAAMIAAVYSKSIAGAHPCFVIQGTLKQTLLNQAVNPLHSETFHVVWTLGGVNFWNHKLTGHLGSRSQRYLSANLLDWHGLLPAYLHWHPGFNLL